MVGVRNTPLFWGMKSGAGHLNLSSLLDLPSAGAGWKNRGGATGLDGEEEVVLGARWGVLNKVSTVLLFCVKLLLTLEIFKLVQLYRL